MLTKDSSRNSKKNISNIESKNYLKDVRINTQSFINSTGAKSINAFGKLYNQANIRMPQRKNQQDLSNEKKEFSVVVQIALQKVKQAFNFFISLTKPATIESDEYIEKEQLENEKVENESFINKPNFNDDFSPSTSTIVNKFTNDQQVPQYEEAKEEATIGLIGINSTENNEGDTSTFDKLEGRLLSKLKESGMSNYDIWLELGDLYLKYNESKKAMEIYALVLKHSKNEKHKELARNGLIGI